ncbi:MAG: anaerobic ribonucleoside-triphosphate reductase activating protein [Duncaniella sp.]|nr:anaerobic ribonucleoside-triphosphate reductase activating protein [Duncaniella sp.]
MRVIRIVEGTSVDGPGLRTAIYFAGCGHHCEGCHNPSTWDPAGGEEMSVSDIMSRVEEAGFNVTLTGGDPLYDTESMLPLAAELKKRGYNVWCYTGFTYEHVLGDSRLRRILDFIDVLVDGPFIAAQRDIKLRFRGSANQRLIDVPASLSAGTVKLFDDGND